MPRPARLLLPSQLLLLCAYVCACASGGVATQALPWRVPCPARCVCQIKPWFSPESVYREAPTVDCNDLLLSQLPPAVPRHAHTLRLQSNRLSALDGAALAALPNLTELDLSQNHFRAAGSLTQGHALPALLSLHLEENQLAHLPRAAFCALPALQELLLSHNRLRSLAPGAFAGLHALLRLHLNNNRLTSVDPRWFGALPRLEVLMLGGNPVEALPDGGFRALGSLRSLVLGGMGLRGLPERALEGLHSLESLSFYDNRLTGVPTRALRRVTALKFLDLNKNRIGLVRTGDFRDMAHLKELGLNNMEELVSVERAALENLPELTKLEITNNPRLAYVHPHAFLRLGRLESLMLNSNALSALHGATLLALPGLREVSLHSNPLRCDCLFRWAAAAGREDGPRAAVRFIQPQATLCSEPPELRARRVRELSSREMSASCLPLIAPGPLPPYVGVREGGRLALHCRALAEPPPRVYWVTPSGVRLGPSPGRTSNHTPDSDPSPAPHASPASSHQRNLTRSFSRAPDPSSLPGHAPSHYRLLPEGTLEIVMATPKEAGLYTCVAENELGADTRTVTVGVRGVRRRAGLSHLRGSPSAGAGGGGGVQVREVGRGYAVLSLATGRNLPSARLSWRAAAVAPHSDTPMHAARVLAGAQSFNITHLQPGTLYRACLHTGAAAAEGSGRGEGGRPLCVTLRTVAAPAEAEPDLSLSPELTSAALLLLSLTLLLLALQACHARDASEKPHALLQEVKGHQATSEAQLEQRFSSANQITGSVHSQPGQGEKGSAQPMSC